MIAINLSTFCKSIYAEVPSTQVTTGLTYARLGRTLRHITKHYFQAYGKFFSLISVISPYLYVLVAQGLRYSFGTYWHR